MQTLFNVVRLIVVVDESTSAGSQFDATVAVLIIVSLVFCFCGEKTRESLIFLCLFPKKLLIHVDQYLAIPTVMCIAELPPHSLAVFDT